MATACGLYLIIRLKDYNKKDRQDEHYGLVRLLAAARSLKMFIFTSIRWGINILLRCRMHYAISNQKRNSAFSNLYFKIKCTFGGVWHCELNINKQQDSTSLQSYMFEKHVIVWWQIVNLINPGCLPTKPNCAAFKVQTYSILCC